MSNKTTLLVLTSATLTDRDHKDIAAVAAEQGLRPHYVHAGLVTDQEKAEAAAIFDACGAIDLTNAIPDDKTAEELAKIDAETKKTAPKKGAAKKAAQ
jgi:hypothetical protein